MSINNSMSDRLLLAMKEMKFTQQQLSSISGVSQSSISKICNGGAKRSRYTVELAGALGVNPQWLATGEGEMWIGGDISMAAIAALEKITGVKNRVETIPVSVERIDSGRDQPGGLTRLIEGVSLNRQEAAAASIPTKSGALKMFSHRGDSMSPTIKNGDLLIVDSTSRSISGGGIYAFKLNNQISVSRLQMRVDGSITFIYDNSTYPQDTLPSDKADQLEVIGMVMLTINIRSL